MVSAGPATAEPSTSAWSPLRGAAYRNLWLALLAANIGTWMQTVGAQWLLIDERNASTLVALVQTASMLPILLLALPAVHALARSHPGARVHVATFDPGGALLARDPLVASVRTTSDHTGGAPRRFVEGLLDARAYDLAVTTTTYDGIGALLRARVPRTAVPRRVAAGASGRSEGWSGWAAAPPEEPCLASSTKAPRL